MPRSIKDSAQQHASSSTSHYPIASPYSLSSPRLRRHFVHPNMIQELEGIYSRDPWPLNTTLEELERQHKVSFDCLFDWFSERRAKTVGLPGGYIDMIPDESRDFVSYQSFVAIFIENEEWRAEQVRYAQDMASYFAVQIGNEGILFDVPEVEGHVDRLANTCVNGGFINGGFSSMMVHFPEIVPPNQIIPVEPCTPTALFPEPSNGTEGEDALFTQFLIDDLDIVTASSPSTNA